MPYHSLEQCLLDLEKNGELLRITKEVDPYLEMAAIHLRVYEQQGPAILFEKVKGSKFRAASNIFGTLKRSKFIFRKQLATVQNLIKLKGNPIEAIKHPFDNFASGLALFKALPKKNPISKPILYQEINIEDIPQIHHWKNDGGAFVTLPQVYTEDVDAPGIMKSNLGMYRIQLSGNDYIKNEEIGLHYQLHRGIGVHQTKANKAGVPLKVSCFVGGPPAHTLAAVMPLPEGISEATFAGVLGNKRFGYFYRNGFCISADADFVITGTVETNINKPEGPFGDHLGYYSLQHPFPVLKVDKVYAKKDAIWAFTVVGRPPQEDTSFGNLIHELTGDAIAQEIPGLLEINAVDAAGVHPLLLAIGSERYTPYLPTKQPSELLTIANHILGTGQLSLAKFLFITADPSHTISTHNILQYFTFVLERLDTTRDIHFYTNTTIDTLDYSGNSLNFGSKVVFAACGNAIKELATQFDASDFTNNFPFVNPQLVAPGIVALQANSFTTYKDANALQQICNNQPSNVLEKLKGIALIILCDDAHFVAQNLNNFLWVTFTRCNPSYDIFGVNQTIDNKHWGCQGPIIIDARIKPHHAPILEKDAAIEKKVDELMC
jgi:4-hydroxy-3-polyprenylbenzoate decarboxylase